MRKIRIQQDGRNIGKENVELIKHVKPSILEENKKLAREDTIGSVKGKMICERKKAPDMGR